MFVKNRIAPFLSLPPFLRFVEGEGGDGSGAGQGGNPPSNGGAGTGSSEGQPGGQEPPKTDPPADPPKPDDTAGLKSALESERALRRDAEKKLKDLPKLQARVEELESAGKSEAEKAAETARREGRTEAMKTANGRLVQAEARALAAEAKFRDPARAVRLLDGLDDVTVADDGTVDTAAIRKQLDELAKDADYLLAGDPEPPKPTPPKPDPSQGPRGSKTTGTDVGREMFQNRRGKKPAPAS